MSVIITLTDSQLMALKSIIAEHVLCPNHTEVYHDIINQVETTFEDVLALILQTEPQPVTPIDTMIAAINKMEFAQLTHCGTPMLEKLLNSATLLFEHFSAVDQALATSIMMGILWATMEGEPVEFEQAAGYLIGMEDRLRIWSSNAKVCYREALEARKHKDSPSSKREVH